MKRILCYGDSNTWGVVPRASSEPIPSERYPEDVRWPQVMRHALGENWQLIEEGMGGRTTIYQAPGEAYRLGDAYLHPCLLSHRPLDYVVVMLGTNDLQPRLHPGPFTEKDLSIGFDRILSIPQALPECGIGNIPPRVLILAPPPIRLSSSRPEVSERYGNEAGVLLSGKLPGIIAAAARRHHVDFLDASLYAEAADADGVHFTRESHLRLGQAVARKIKEMSTRSNPHLPPAALQADIEL